MARKENVFAQMPKHALHTNEDSKKGAGLDAEGIEYKGADAESTAAFIDAQASAAKGDAVRKSAVEVARELAARKKESKN